MSISRLMQMAAGGAGGVSHWIASYSTGSTGTPRVAGVREFSNGDILIFGSMAINGSGVDPFAARLSSADGSVIWSRKLEGPSGQDYIIENAYNGGCHIDSSDNIYLGFSDYNGSYAGFMRLNSNGTTAWSGNSYWYNKNRTYCSKLVGDDADIYAIGSTSGIQSGYRGLITQWDTSNGDFQADRAQTGSNTGYAFGGCIKNGRIGMAGYSTYWTYTHAVVQVTYANNLATAGDVTGIRSTTFNIQGTDIAIDSSGNRYVAARLFSGKQPWAIYKLNSALNTITWQKYYEPANTTNASVGHIALQMTDDNRLFCLSTYQLNNNSSQQQSWIGEIDISNGNVIWSNTFNVGSQTYLPSIFTQQTYNFLLHSDESVIYGVTDTNGVFHLLKVPMDGSLTGTYGSYTYSAISTPYNTSLTSSTITGDSVGWSTSGDDQTGSYSTQNLSVSVPQTNIETL